MGDGGILEETRKALTAGLRSDLNQGSVPVQQSECFSKKGFEDLLLGTQKNLSIS